MSVVIHTRRVSRCVERECNGGFGKWKFKLYNNRRIFLADLKKEFGGGDIKTMKVVEL